MSGRAVECMDSCRLGWVGGCFVGEWMYGWVGTMCGWMCVSWVFGYMCRCVGCMDGWIVCFNGWVGWVSRRLSGQAVGCMDGCRL